MNQKMKDFFLVLDQPRIFRLSKLLGFLISVSIGFAPMIMGVTLVDVVFTKGVLYVIITLWLRQFLLACFLFGVLLFLASVSLIIYDLRRFKQFSKNMLNQVSYETFQKEYFQNDLTLVLRVFSGILLGYFAGELLFFYLMDKWYFLGAFQLLPYLFGSFFMFSETLLTVTSGWTVKTWHFILNVKQTTSIRQAKKWLKYLYLGLDTTTTLGLFLLGLLLFSLNAPAISGYYPSPPHLSADSYGSLQGSRPFSVVMKPYRLTIDSTILTYLSPENGNMSWYSFVFLPVNTRPQSYSYPLAIILPGYSGIFPEYYLSVISLLASQGLITIFIQYPTYITPKGPYTRPSNATVTTLPEHKLRYDMMWLGINQTIHDLLYTHEVFTSSFLETHLGIDYTIDSSRIMIFGHSYGGGATPFISSRLLSEGFAQATLIIDMESPWYKSEYPGTLPDYSLFHNHTYINIVGYQYDTVVSPIIGMKHYEAFLANSRNTNASHVPQNQTQYILIRSDYYGYPRLLTSHYMPVDQLKNSLSEFGIFRRIDAMAAFLFASSNENTSQKNLARSFFLNTSIIQFMGYWSDQTPVKPCLLSQDPLGIYDPASSLLAHVPHVASFE